MGCAPILPVGPGPGVAESTAGADNGEVSDAAAVVEGQLAYEIRPVRYDHPDARALTERVQQVYVARYGGRDTDPADPDQFAPPGGGFFVGYEAGVPVAMGGWRRSGEEALGTAETAEIKRMYVVEEAQGRGYARRMLAHLEKTAAAGYAGLVLSTGDKQPEALALYVSAGYTEIDSYGYYAGSPLNRCFAKRLDRD